MPGNGAAPSHTKIANLNGVLTPNTAKYHGKHTLPGISSGLRRIRPGALSDIQVINTDLHHEWTVRIRKLCSQTTSTSNLSPIPFAGIGSFVFNFLFPGLPSSFFTAVGFGFLPATGIPSFLNFLHTQEINFLGYRGARQMLMQAWHFPYYSCK